MYMLWGGGAPFKEQSNGTLLDRNNRPVTLHSGVRAVMRELAEDPEWRDAVVAAASCCDEPSWARECLAKFDVRKGKKLDDVVTIREIHKGNKQGHFRTIRGATGCEFEEMIFFDTEPYNCYDVAELGVTCIYCPNGVT